MSVGHSVIPIVNKLQDIFANLGNLSEIELPEVAVIGSQSSGKSSVLEALVGRDFLPRGNDVCTRRPLLLQLQRKADGTTEEWGEFLHLPEKKFFDFNEIRKEIQAETEKEAGGDKVVSDKPILLKIYSPNVIDLSLVDLPGLTKVPVGDQTRDIEILIKNMIYKVIKRDCCLILAVTPANSDLANSDALQMAGMADPDGHRTIGVITKLDIMDRGTDARNFLLGKVIPLRLGYVGIVNRSQKDIQLNRSIKDALIAEEKFFHSHPVYTDIADHCGVPQLVKKLNQILVQHIKNVLPGLKSHISAALMSAAKEHASYEEIIESKALQGVLILNILSKYTEALVSMIEGKHEEMLTAELFGGARIRYIFQNIFVKTLEAIDPCEDLTDNDIHTAIQNASGTKPALFVPEVLFEVLVRKQVARLMDPSLQCARLIYDELVKMSHDSMLHELQRYPALREGMNNVVGNFLRDGLRPSETMIGHLIEMEMDYINTSHPNFVGGSKALEIAKQQIKSSGNACPSAQQKDSGDSQKAPKSGRNLKFRNVLAPLVNRIVPELGVLPVLDVGGATSVVCNSGLRWGVSSIFGRHDISVEFKVSSTINKINEPAQSMEQDNSIIHLTEPPSVLMSSETYSEQRTVEIKVIKLLLESYYDIVRKNIEDSVPKAIMHFLVNRTKRELHNVFIRQLYRENLFDELLQEPEEISIKRKRALETVRVLRQASRALDELPLDVDMVANC